MKLLIIGSGGREHALAWKLRQSPRVSEVICAPGNGGICTDATCLPVDLRSVDAMLALATKLQPDLTIIGPELPLTLGIVDELTKRGLRGLNRARASPRNSCSATRFLPRTLRCASRRRRSRTRSGSFTRRS